MDDILQSCKHQGKKFYADNIMHHIKLIHKMTLKLDLPQILEHYVFNMNDRRTVSQKLQVMDDKERNTHMTPLQAIQEKTRRMLMKELVAHPSKYLVSKMTLVDDSSSEKNDPKDD